MICINENTPGQVTEGAMTLGYSDGGGSQQP